MLFQKLMGKGPTSMISPSAPKGLWSWGNNTMGHLGLGDRVYRSSPTQVGTLTTWLQIVGSFKRSLALKTDGTLWSARLPHGPRLREEELPSPLRLKPTAPCGRGEGATADSSV